MAEKGRLRIVDTGRNVYFSLSADAKSADFKLEQKLGNMTMKQRQAFVRRNPNNFTGAVKSFTGRGGTQRRRTTSAGTSSRATKRVFTRRTQSGPKGPGKKVYVGSS